MLLSLASLMMLVPSVFVGTAYAASAPSPPGLTYLYSLNCSLGDVALVGNGPQGDRVVIPIIGGAFSGPRINGTVLDIGADWSLKGTDGTSHVDTRYQLLTDDGANIFIQTNGPSQPDGHIHLRMTFETGSPDYFWLNNIVAIGILSSWEGGGVSIDAWQLDSPQ